jgi:hypothetical protein
MEYKGHDCCSNLHRDSNLSTRVIKVSLLGRQHLQLLESSNLRGVYIMLFYYWGKTPFSALTWSNYSQLVEELDLPALSATIYHAILAACDFSILYLLINALYII